MSKPLLSIDERIKDGLTFPVRGWTPVMLGVTAALLLSIDLVDQLPTLFFPIAKIFCLVIPLTYFVRIAQRTSAGGTKVEGIPIHTTVWESYLAPAWPLFLAYVASFVFADVVVSAIGVRESLDDWCFFSVFSMVIPVFLASTLTFGISGIFRFGFMWKFLKVDPAGSALLIGSSLLPTLVSLATEEFLCDAWVITALSTVVSVVTMAILMRLLGLHIFANRYRLST